MNNPKCSSAGITLIELLLVVLLVSIFAGLTVPSFSSSIARHQVDDAAVRIAHAIEYGKVLARARNEPVTLSFAPGAVTLKRSNGTLLKQVELPSRVTISGLNPITVSSVGQFSQTGSITLTSTIDGSRTRQVVLATNYGSVTIN